MNESEEKEVSDLLNKIFTPILLTLGIIGNVLSIIIFSKSSLNKNTTFKYLLLLSVLDLCVLISGCGQILFDVYFNFDIRSLNVFSCKIHAFMVIFFTHSSSMLLVCMSVDRVLVIKMKKDFKISNPKSATRVFWILLLVIGTLNIHLILFNNLIVVPKYEYDTNVLDENTTDIIETISSTFAPKPPSKNHTSSKYVNKTSNSYSNFSTNKNEVICYAPINSTYYKYLIIIFPWIDLIFYVIFPSTVMLICSIIIISKIFSTNNRLSAYSNTISRRRTIKNRQISYLLLTTNLFFFLLVSPLLVLNAMSLIEPKTVRSTIAYLLSYANHGLNFIFYGITCQRYRSELFKLINGILIDKSNQTDQKYELVTSVNDKRKLTTIFDQE